MSRFTVVYDACVLYPAPLRDFLIQLAGTGLFRARWTDRINDEWIENLLKNRSELSRERLNRTRDLMNRSVPDCIVRDYQNLEKCIELPDENDRHVVAAAIKCHANAIVTFNLKDFPQSALANYELEALHPDDFINCQIGLSSAIVCSSAKACRERLVNPRKTVDEYLQRLEQQELSQTVSALRYFSDLL
jgi:predicted nucleic acid-binding protein